MKKLLPIIFIAICIVICAVPAVGMAVYGPSSAGANEIQSSAPVLKTEDGLNTEFLSDVSDYVSDHFYLRQELITAHNRTVSALFSVSAEDDVILGSDSWLYYESTIGDYTGTANMTVRELFSAANNLYLLSEYAEEHGAELVFAIAPNKNSVYPEYMPSYGAVSQYHNAAAIIKLLGDMGVKAADFFSVFDSVDEILYFSHDSHWNSKGAALGADVINELFGVESRYYTGDFSASEPHTGDLFEMIYPTGTDSETNPVYGGELTLSYENPSVKPDSITINVSGGGEKRLLAYRDSFGNLLYPYLADSFAWSRFSRSTVYDMTLIDELSVDCVLIELVERNLSYLLTYTPLMPSPVRDIELPDEYSGSVSAGFSESTRAPKDYIAFTGTVQNADSFSPVYAVIDGVCYEAFLGQDDTFTAFIEAEAAGGSLAVMYEHGGETVLAEASAN